MALLECLMLRRACACLLGLAACGTGTTSAASDDAMVADTAADLAIGDAGADTPAPDPLVGTWTFSGMVPAIVTLTLTFKADQTFALAETVAPPTLPAGVTLGTCVTTDSLHGTYAVTANTLTLNIAGGTDNAVSGCTPPTNDTPGTVMTPDDITALTAEGLLLPPTETYTVSASTLVLTDPGKGLSKTFTH